MISCPNKSSKEWQTLSNELGEDNALLAYFRNGDIIPDVATARELITNRGLLESIQRLPMISEQSILDTLRSTRLISGEPFIDGDKEYYQLNQNIENLADELGKITDTYGAVLNYKSDYVTINKDTIDVWNNIASAQALETKTATQLAKDFLDRVGVAVVEQDDLVKMYGSNGIANIAEKMVTIQSGKMDEALPEEALHFFLDMLPQDHEALTEALDKIRNTSVYKETLAQYKNNPNYRTAEGQVRFDKIRKEALAKKLAADMIEGKKKTGWVEAIIDAILNWIMSRKVQKTPNEKLLDLFYSKEITLLNTNLQSSEMYNQLQDSEKTFYEAQNMNEDQRNTLNKLISYAAATGFDEDTHTYDHAGLLGNQKGIKSVTTILGSDFYSELEGADIMIDIVNNFELEFPEVATLTDNEIETLDIDEQDALKAKRIIDYIQERLITEETTREYLEEVVGEKIAELLFKASEAKTKTLFGTAIHSIVEKLALGKDFDLDEAMANEKIENIALSKIIDRKTLDRIVNGTIYEKGIKDVIKDLRENGSIIVTELALSNGRLGGKLDIISISPEGVVDIYDFKTVFLKNRTLENKNYVKENLIDEFHAATSRLSKEGVKDEPDTLEKLRGVRRSKKQKFSQQLSIYKKLLMEAGVKVGTLNVIGIPYRLDEKTGKVSDIKIELIKNMEFNKTLGDYYFPTLDKSLDANVKKDVPLDRDERVKTLDRISKDKLKESFVKALARITEISNKYGKKGIEKLYDELVDEASRTNRLDIQKSNILTVLNNFDDIQDIANIQTNFLEMIESSYPIIKIAMDYFDTLKNSTPTDRQGASQRLNELMKTKDFLMGYKNMFDDILKYLSDIENDNPLVKNLSEMSGLIEKVRSNYVDVITPVIYEMIKDVFNKDSLATIVREYNELIAAAKARGDEERAASLKEERDNLPSEKVIKELLKGNKGDVGWFFSKLMATASNPDIIIAGAAKKLKATLDRVRIDNKEWRDTLGKELEKRRAIYGKGIDIKAINESLVYVAEEINPYTGKVMNVLHFKSEFDEKLYFDYNALLYALKKAEESNDRSDIIQAKKDIKDFETKFMQTGYTPAYYAMTKPLDTKVMYQGREMTVREIDGEFKKLIRELQSQYSEDDKLNGALNDDYINELRSLYEKRAELREKLNSNGTPKTGDALRIAEILEEYDKNKSKLFEEVEQTEYFNRSREKAKLQYGENSEEFKKWMANNTRLVIKPEFYTKRQALYEEQAQLLGTLDSKEIADLRRELSTLTGPYKDKDGFIQANMISDETSKKIKDIEDKIQVLQSTQLDLKRGLTKEEKDRLDVLNYAKSKNLPYSKEEVSLILMTGRDRLEQRKLEDPTFESKLIRLQEISAELSSMGNMENSKYYNEELQKREEDFAEAMGITYSELLDGIEPVSGEKYYALFKETPWYQENHIIDRKILYGDEDSEDVREVIKSSPTYQWKRFMPLEGYIEQKPAKQFYKFIEKESYVNDRGETIVLKNTDNLDVLGRFKPKTNEDYRREYGEDHPYLNKDFVNLRNRYNNQTASAKERVDYENLIFIHDNLIKAQEKIEPKDRLGLAVPFLEKKFVERTIESRGENVKEGDVGVFNSMAEGIKRTFKRTDQDVDQNGVPTGDQDVRNNSAKLATMDNDEVKHIPVRFSTKGEAKNASYDIWGGVLQYVGAINRKSELQKDLAFINGLEEILSDKENQPKSEDKNMVLNNIYKRFIPELEAKINKGTNVRLEVLKSFVNSVMYNEEYFQGFDILGVNSHKAISVVMGLTSFAKLGLAPLNWGTNYISGNIQNLIEALDGRNYNFRDFKNAHADIYGGGKYGSAINDMKEDFIMGKVGNLSFWGQIMEIWDPIQGEFEDGFGHKTNFNIAKNIFTLGLYAGKVWGEWEIQMKSFIAFMKNHKLYNGKVLSREDFITEKMGTDVEDLTVSEINAKRLQAIEEWNQLDVNLLDMHQLDSNGKMSIKPEYQNAFQFGSEEFSNIVGKLHAMQKRLNGSYAKFDKAYAEKSSLGRMMFFFRKFVVPLGVARFGTRRTDYESMRPEQGFYLTFIQTVGKDLVKLRFNVIKNWANYSPSERKAIVKTMADIGIVISLFLAYTVLFGYDPDDKDRFKKLREKGWAAQAAVFLLIKVKSETQQFLPIYGTEEIKNIYSNPSLVFKGLTDYMTITRLLLEHSLDVLPGVDYSSSLYYQKQVDHSGLKDVGDPKVVAAMFKLIGYTGGTFEPVQNIKNYESFTRR